jgi:hypothetical protein
MNSGDLFAPEKDEGPSFDLGPCCYCGNSGPTVRNLLMLPKRTVVPGTGWGCLICGLPADGALAVLCDTCLLRRKSPRFAIKGWLKNKDRILIDELTEPFAHILSKHKARERSQAARWN